MVEVSSPPRDLGGTILRNTLAATAAAWTIKILNFAFIIYVVRILGDAGLGRYATVVAFVGLFSVFSELGLAQYVERSVARDPSQAERLFGNLVALRMLLAVAGVVVVTGLAYALGYDPEIVAGIFLLTLTFLLSAVAVPLTTLLSANERFDLLSGIHVIVQLLTMAAGFILLQVGAGFFALLLTGFIVMPIQILLTLYAVRRHDLGTLSLRMTPDTWPTLIRASIPFGLTSLALTFNFNVDTVILGFFHSDSVVGWYNAAYRLVFNAVGIVGGFLAVMTPSIAREHQRDPERVARWVRSSIRWMLLFSIPASAGMSLLAPRVIALLYGSGYSSAGPALAILAWDIPLLLLNSFFGNVTAAIGLERPAAKIYLGSAGLNVVLNLLFIPTFGIVAAATVTIATDVISAGLFFALLRRAMGMVDLGRTASGVAAATALMGVVVWLLGSTALPIVIVAGGVVYALAAMRLGVLDIAALVRVFRRGAPEVTHGAN
jgi:O-antigen/teichoic acid export membrane protein